MRSHVFSLVSNASMADEVRIRHTVPSWLRVFGDRVSEVVIVVDLQAPSGRIAELHRDMGTIDSLWKEIGELERQDSRVRHLVLPSEEGLEQTARRWFIHGRPLRCQAGTPILAFLYAIDAAKETVVLRADCDMLFLERGWLDRAIHALEADETDLVEPPRLGTAGPTGNEEFSTRAFLLDPRKLAARALPMKPHRLGWPWRIHRMLHGRPTWWALEQMVQKEKEAGRIRHAVLDEADGFSMHVVHRGDVALPGFEQRVVARFESGALPDGQRTNWDFDARAWPSD